MVVFQKVEIYREIIETEFPADRCFVVTDMRSMGPAKEGINSQSPDGFVFHRVEFNFLVCLIWHGKELRPPDRIPMLPQTRGIDPDPYLEQ